MLQTRHKPRLPIAGTATPDNPQGIVTTAAGALKWTRANMPADLKRAGFVATIVKGKTVLNGAYSPCWRGGYSK